MKKLIVPIGVFLLSLFLFWYAGIELFQRGGAQAFCLVLAVLISAYASSLPNLPKEYKLL